MNKHLKNIVIVGAGGIARQVLDILLDCNKINLQYNILGFVVENNYYKENTVINEFPVVGNFDWLKTNIKQLNIICAVGDVTLKKRWVSELNEYNPTYINAIHPNAIITKWNNLGTGNIIDIACIISNTESIGNHNLFNLQVTLGHDVIIEDYVTIGPGSHISGNVSIGSETYIGTGANVIEKKDIGNNCVIGAGACVVTNIPNGATAVGVPAKIIKVREDL